MIIAVMEKERIVTMANEFITIFEYLTNNPVVQGAVLIGAVISITVVVFSFVFCIYVLKKLEIATDIDIGRKRSNK